MHSFSNFAFLNYSIALINSTDLFCQGNSYKWNMEHVKHPKIILCDEIIKQEFIGWNGPDGNSVVHGCIYIWISTDRNFDSVVMNVLAVICFNNLVNE